MLSQQPTVSSIATSVDVWATGGGGGEALERSGRSARGVGEEEAEEESARCAYGWKEVVV